MTIGVSFDVFAGPGEMRAHARAFDWAASALGPVEQWPESLRTAVAIMLGSGFPMILVWGPELIQLYNDAYIPLIDAKHPRAFGLPTHACWPEIRSVQEPTFARVFRGETVQLTEAHYALNRHDTGTLEDAYFDATFVPVPLASGATGGSLSVLFESTDRVHARSAHAEREKLREAAAASELAKREAVERALHDVAAANRSKSEFLAVMSHELRTPLNAIGGYVELIELGIRGPVTEEQRTDLMRIRSAQRHLLGLVTDVLNFVRIETGRLHYALTDVCLSEIVASVEVLIRPQFQAKNIALEPDCPDPGVQARADPEKLVQILVNLLTNALKFTDAGGRVSVVCDNGESTVTVRVRDTGIGIAPDKLQVIFDPFVQVDQRFTRRNEGVGLGLAISRDLARGMGAELTVESTPGVGSMFTLALPRA